MSNFEIGVVYHKDLRHFIAVDNKTLVCCEGGEAVETRPITKYDVIRTISVEDLCAHWKITLARFDELMSAYLTPPQDTVKSRPRGNRSKKGEDEEYWRRHRTGRIARPAL